jgi:hypothetical protein
LLPSGATPARQSPNRHSSDEITARKKMTSSTGMFCSSFTHTAISAKKKLANSM